VKKILVEDLYTVVYILVNDWYRNIGQFLLPSHVGDQPDFTDSEMLTVMLGIDFFEFTSERRYLEFVRANYLTLFPRLLSQSQFNRRARQLRGLLEALRQAWATDLGNQWERHFLLDTTPIITVGYNRDKTNSEFYGSANYGYCAARKLHYYGYKLVMLTTLDGLPYSFELVPANTDERIAADEVLGTLPGGSSVWSDKGFIGSDWQAEWKAHGVYLWTAKRENQKEQNPPAFDRLLNSVRERIEGMFDQLKEGGRSVEHTLAHTVEGLCARIGTKITCITLRVLLRKIFGIDLLTYSIAA
jgi:hypothetical protein